MPDTLTITVPFEELLGSPREELDASGTTMRRTLRCNWADRLTLARQLLGGHTAQGTFLPHTYPGRAARVHHIAIQPLDPPAPLAASTSQPRAYRDAQLTVDYRTFTGRLDNARLISESLEPFNEQFILDGESLFWLPTSASGQGAPLGDALAPARQSRGFNWLRTHHQVTSLPITVLNLAGHINNTATASPTLGLTFPARTLLYHPPTIRQTTNADDLATWDVTFRFSFRPHDWNLVFDPQRAQHHSIYARGQSQPLAIYPQADFATLFA